MVISMKKIWKDNAKLILVIVISVVLASGVSYATVTMYASNTVSYDNTTSGLRSTNVQGALDELYGCATNYNAYDVRLENVEDLITANAGFHNSIFRGKDITSYYNDGTLWKRINGTDGYELFEDLYVGDYIKVDGVHANVNGKTWRIAGFDIYYMVGTDGNVVTSHHAVIVPDEILGTSVMNTSNTTEGSYVGSYMYTTTLPSVKTNYIDKVFDGHLVKYVSLLATRVCSIASAGNTGYNGSSCDWGWQYNRYLDLMNEMQVTGSTVWSSSGYDVGSDYIQFPLFRLRPEFTRTYNSNTHTANTRDWYWLRSVVSASQFAVIGIHGSSDRYDAGGIYGVSTSLGVRPYFYIS